MKRIKKAQAGTTLTPQQKRAKLDSIAAVRRAEIVRKKDSILDRNAAAKGMTREEVRAQQKKDAKKPNVSIPGLQTDRACKRGESKGSCSTGQTNTGESLKDTRKNGGKVMKNGGKTPAWQRKEGKNPSGGLNKKGVASYRKANPGSKLKMAVTTKPSKLDPDGKAAKRRKSFCARMSGVKGPMKKPNGKPTRKALALKKWNC